MGITQDGLLKRRKTGGKPAQYMKKRKFAMGRPASNTKLGAQRVRTIRVRFGLTKKRALRLDSGTYSWGSEGVARKTRILSVVYNPTNNEFVRTNTIVKGEIVAVDATPFKLWYETYYGVAIGRKVVVHKTDAKKGAVKGVKGAVKGVAKGAAKAPAKDAKPAAAKSAAAKPAAAKPVAAKPAAAKDAAKPAAKEAKPAAAKPTAAKGVAKTITKPDAKAAAKAPAKGVAAPAKGSAAAKSAAKAAKGGKIEKTEVVDKKKDYGPLPAKHLKAIPNNVPGTLTGSFIDQNRSKLVRSKHAQRGKRRVLEPLFEEQFSSGRLLACISSRPGQSGAADGYLLEGKELDFYLKKVKKNK